MFCLWARAGGLPDWPGLAALGAAAPAAVAAIARAPTGPVHVQVRLQGGPHAHAHAHTHPAPARLQVGHDCARVGLSVAQGGDQVGPRDAPRAEALRAAPGPHVCALDRQGQPLLVLRRHRPALPGARRPARGGVDGTPRHMPGARRGRCCRGVPSAPAFGSSLSRKPVRARQPEQAHNPSLALHSRLPAAAQCERAAGCRH